MPYGSSIRAVPHGKPSEKGNEGPSIDLANLLDG